MDQAADMRQPAMNMRRQGCVEEREVFVWMGSVVSQFEFYWDSKASQPASELE
jgi:hypothetical protein